MKKIQKLFLINIAAMLCLCGCSGREIVPPTSETTSHQSSTSSTGEERVDERYAIYELALKAGYTGTYEEWLATVKGDKGDPGSSLLNGTSNPGSSIGNNGDIYINTSTWDIFVKNDGNWTLIGNVMGPKGEPGDNGDTPYIGQNGHWWIGSTDTGVVAAGQNGEPGSNGKSAYEIYCETHPEYQGNEAQWLDDLVNGRLGNKEIHTVSFDTTTGESISSQQIVHGEKAVKPQDPVKNGYRFAGWTYKGEIWSFIGYCVTENMTLTASWEIETYTITYLEVSSGQHSNPMTFTIEDEIVLLDAYRPDQKFICWTKDGEPIEKIERGTTGDITLTANWEAYKSVTIWTGFGSSYTYYMQSIFVDPLITEEDTLVGWRSFNGYDNLQSSVLASIADRSYPDFVNGYDSQFSCYIDVTRGASNPTGIVQSLDDLLDDSELNSLHMQKTGYSLREDYICDSSPIAFDSNGNAITTGVPFNNNKNVLMYNGYFFDYVKSQEPSIKVPETWAEWETFGPIFRQYQMSLSGKYLYGKVNDEGIGYDFSLTSGEGRSLLLDFTDVYSDSQTAVLTVDSLDDLFITLVKQFGASFSSFTSQDFNAENANDRHGYVDFYYGDNKAKSISAMQLIRNLFGTGDNDRVFAPAQLFGSMYSSDAFKNNQVMFAIVTNGGLSYNVGGEQDVRFAPIPYKDSDHKYVTNYGTNLAMLRDEKKDVVFDIFTKMTTGEKQAEWAKQTGYFPVSKSAIESKTYQDFLNSTESDNKVLVAYRDFAKLNINEYLNAEKHWINYSEPVFRGAEEIKQVAAHIINLICGSDSSIEDILQSAYNDGSISRYVRS